MNYNYNGQWKPFKTQFNWKALPPIKAHIISFLLILVVAFATFYIWMPAINIQTTDTTLYIAMLFGVFGGIDVLLMLKTSRFSKILFTFAIALVTFSFAMNIYSLPIFHANAYHSQLQIETSNSFEEDFSEISMDQIPIIDLQTAKQLGDKKMGTISALGSQFNVSNEYTLINVKNKLYRVSPLEYQDLFKWFQNKSKGIPGFIKVNVSDPNDVELVQLKEGMKYSPSSFFHYNLQRHVRFQFPNDLLDDYSFELDDDGNPYWVVSTYQPRIGFYGGKDATGVILVNPINGECTKYSIDNVPKWVDRVQPADFALTQLDNWGKYVNGFFNTLLGHKDMLSLTKSFNYITLNGQTHIFTGMTSTGADHSINGFALINLKDKKAKFFQINGADEYSAKQSAEGAVQHLGYRATDPLILNIGQKPTYFVALKDQGGLVKNYGFVSLENYSIVGIGETVQSAKNDYLKKLQQNGGTVIDKDAIQTIKARVNSIHSVVIEGTTNYYLTLEGSDKLFIAPVTTSNELILTSIGDEIELSYVASNSNTITIHAFNNLKYQFE